MKNDTTKNNGALTPEVDDKKTTSAETQEPEVIDKETMTDNNTQGTGDSSMQNLDDEKKMSESISGSEIDKEKSEVKEGKKAFDKPTDPLQQEQHVNTTRVFEGDDPNTADRDFSYGDDPYKSHKEDYYGPDSAYQSDDDSRHSSDSGSSSGYDSSYRGDNRDSVYGEYYDPYYGSGYENYGYKQDSFHSSGSQKKPKKNKKNKKNKKYVSRKAFIIGLIVCIILSSLITFGGLNTYWEFKDDAGKNGPKKKVSATNYTLAEETGSNKSIQEIIAQNEDAVVDIATESKVTDVWLQNYVTKGAGSGVIIQSDGYIMTCSHVIGNASTIKVSTKDGNTYDAKVIGSDPITDITVLKIDANNLDVAIYGDSSKLQIGDLAVAIGNPLGQLGGSATTGIISSLDRELEVENRAMTLLQTDASVNPGNSGGGLFNGSGNLIGIVVAKSTGSDVEGLGFAIPINTAAKVAKELIENGKVKDRAAIGVKILDLTDAQRAQQYGMRHTGIYVAKVSSEEARKAGFQAGDMIYEFDGEAVTTEAVLRKSLAKHKPGDEVEVIVIRNGASVKLTTKLIEQ